MSQIVPLMLSKTKELVSDHPVTRLFYNYQSGLWEDENGTAIIANLFKEQTHLRNLGSTNLTRTREGIDRAEQTFDDILYRTSLTKTREGIDTSEEVSEGRL